MQRSTCQEQRPPQRGGGPWAGGVCAVGKQLLLGMEGAQGQEFLLGVPIGIIPGPSSMNPSLDLLQLPRFEAWACVFLIF